MADLRDSWSEAHAGENYSYSPDNSCCTVLIHRRGVGVRAVTKYLSDYNDKAIHAPPRVLSTRRIEFGTTRDSYTTLE